ncbi:MAG TPA: hypothetical protein VEG08_08085 [Terriglobales bacterium]|nr:hypothetical protein [Terriglobales bacterium]
MLAKKLIASAMASGLLWAAGLAGHAVVASHPGLLLLAGQVRISLGDQEGGLRLMEQAARLNQDAPPAAAVPASTTPLREAAAQCPAKASVSRAAARAPRPASLVRVSIQVSPQDFARRIAQRHRDFARQQHELVRLSLEQARWSEHVRVLVQQPMRELPPLPAVPAEPVRANP